MAISNEAQQDYIKSQWAPGMPITQARMDNLEAGVYVNREAIQSLDIDINGVNGLASQLTNITSGIGSNEVSNYADKTLWQAISTLYSTIENATNDSTAGANAWTQIVGLIGQDALGNLKQSLSEYMQKYEQEDANIKMTLGVIIDGTGAESYAYDNVNTVYKAIKALNDALGYDVSGKPVFGTRDGEGNLITVLNTMRALTTNVETVLTALSEAAPSPTYSSLANRLALMSTAIQNATDALSAANVSSVYTTETDGVTGPTTYGTLDERLEHIETEVVKNTNGVNSLNGNINDNYVKKADVRDNFTSTDTNLPLSAAKGKELREMIGGTYNTSNTVTSAINTAASTAENNVKAYTDSLLGAGFTTTDTVAAAINTLENADNTLDGRLQDVEDELIAAHTSAVVRTPGAEEGDPDTDTTYGSLDARLEAIETHANTADTTTAGINSRVISVENALTTLNGNASTVGSVLNTVNTQIATVINEAPEAFDTLKEIADWIGDHSDTALEMQQDISDNADAIAALQNTIDNQETGLAATKAVADSALTKANAAATTEALNSLTNRVNGLEATKSGTVIVDNVQYTEGGIPIYAGANENTDYLFKNGDKYYYWKYITTSTNPETHEWALISGGGGSGNGNTSGMDLTAEEYEQLETYEENTDYYVTRSDGIHHYRYIPDTISGEELVEIEIGISNNYNIGIGTVTETVENEEVDKTYLYLYKFAANEDSTIDDETTLPLIGRGTLVRRVELKGTGGGIGAYEQIRIQPATGQSTVFTVVEGNTAPIVLNLQGQKRDQNGYVATTLITTIQYRERGADTWRTYTQGEKEISVTDEGATNFSTIDISSLLVLNKTMEIKVTAADKNNVELTNSSVTFSISKVELNLTSSFNQSVPYTTNTIAFNYSYTGSGLNKTLYIYLNDTLINTRTLGTAIGNGSYNINMSEKTAGTYNLKAYFVTDDNNTSNTLNYSIMYIPSGETLDHPIVGISVPETSITEGDVLTINYSAYTQNADQTQEILFEIFEENSQTAYTTKTATNVNNNQPSSILFLDYPIPQNNVDSISITIRATASNENQAPYSIEQTVTVTRYDDTSINFDPVETNLIYEFDPVAHTNNDENRAEFTYSPHSGVTYTTTLEDFNWVSNGYLGDEALTFNGDAVMHINVPVLITNVAGTDINDTPTSSGRTVEFEYEVSSVTDINAPIITYFNNSNITENTDTSTKTGVGFEITPQNCYLISEAKSVVTDKKGFIHNEDDIAAAYLSEGSRLRVSFVIESIGTHTTGAGNNAQTVNIYINGQYANSCPYDGNGELFTIPADADCKITIGNDSSILKLYDVRIYNRGLTELEILQNYMTAPLLRRDKLARIRENDLLTTNQKEIDYYKARQHYNCLLITGNLSPAKSEKVSCGLIFTQPNGEGGFDEKFRCMNTFPDGSYTSQNAVQGTSSVKFPVKNYKVYLTSGYELDNENKPKAVKYKYALEPGRVKESTFCWKGDYMSSDHANTFNANWADALESRLDGTNHVQNSVYGFRCLLFHRADDNENTPIVLIGDGTLNNDKGNTKTFQLEDSLDEEGSNDTRSQKWEFKNNTETPCLFQSDNLISLVNGEEDYTAATEAFESTYPDEGDLEDANVRPNYNHLQILLSWVLRRANYWDETDTSARAAKKAIFKNEFSRHFNMDHMLLYYLFCEFTAMTDNRAKNMFIRCDTVRDEEVQDINGVTLFSGNTVSANQNWYNYITGNNAYKAAHYTDIDWENSTFGVWTPILYDLDSCYGVENSGYLQVPYYANWNYRDVADTKYLFNGYGSILWLMFEDSFADEIRAMAQTIYANGSNGEPGLNYNSFYKYHITDNALKFPPVIINQDMNKKYLNPWINGLPDPEDATRMIYNAQYKYLQRGSRTDQKVGFIERRSRMLYSKYLTTQFIANEASVNFRCGNAGAKDPITLIAGTACYPAIQFSDTSSQTVTTAQQYANTGDSVSFTPGEDGMGFSDTVYIRGASMLTGITGIGGYMPYEINLSGGRNLKQLALGSPTVINTQVSSSALSGLDACSILEELNIENFNGSSFTTLNLTSNRLLKHLYATGANNLGTCGFANGGIIEDIELGTGLTNLTLRNQTRIQTLKFGGANTILANNVAKINTIFVEGISAQGMEVVQDIFKTRLFALNNQLINGRAANEAIVLSGGVRISGLNMTLTCRDENGNSLPEADLLDLLINKSAMTGKGLTYDGTLSSTAYPYLSGTLTINRGQDKKIAILHEMYPNLTIVENNSVTSYIVTYEHDDGTILETLYVDEGSAAPDIYSTGILAEMPTKPQTERESYRFGSVNEVTGNYITYSGWHLNTSNQPISSTGTPFVFSNLRIITYFIPVPRTYQIRWYLDKNPDNRLVKTSPGLVSYGGGYDQEAPTVKDIHTAGFETCSIAFNGANVSYKIFNGWEKLPTNITPTANDTYYAIHANWIEANNVSINGLFENTATLTPEQLFVLSAMDNQMKEAYNINSKIDVSGANRLVCTMGADSIAEGTELVSTPLRLDQDGEPRTTSIQPLKSGNDAFTLVIDYCFNEEMTNSITTNYSTLVSCYYSNIAANVKNGFSLFYGKSGNNISGPRIGFGDIYNSASQSVLIGSEAALNMRNIVVLRHPANEPTLYIYSGISGSTLPTEVVLETLNWQNYNSNAYLNIGQLGNDADSTDGATRQVSNGKGTIYWMKYWPEDLGQGECKKLASWPHEQITYGIAYLSDNATSTTRAISNTATSSIHLASLNTLSHGTYYQGRTQESGLGWGNSNLQTIMNNRIMNGLPVTLQSILCKDSTSYTVGERQDGGQGQISYGLSSSGGIVRDYIRPYSLAHVIPNEAVYKNAEESVETAPFPWLDSDNIMVYDYGSNGWALNTSNDRTLVNYLNIRFPNKAITWGAGTNRMRVFREINSGTVVPTSTTVANTIYQATNTLKSGDIYIMKRGETEYTFIYATTQEILTLGLQPASTSFDSRLGAPTLTDTRGLWIRAEQYWTRSVIVYNGFNFGYVYEQGTPNTNVTNQVDSRGLKFSQILTI